MSREQAWKRYHLSFCLTNGCMSDLILLIDDDATLLGLLAEHLSRTSYRAVTASCGTMGIKAVNEQLPTSLFLM